MTNTAFGVWTAKDVERRILEAADTLMLCPRAHGPSGFQNSMPEPVQRQLDAYGSGRARHRRMPSPGAIDRMEACWGWINSHPDAKERSLVYAWARIKCGKGRSLGALARNLGMSDRDLRRKVGRICASIAGRLNINHVSDTDQIGEVPANNSRSSSGATKNPHHWIDSESRPQIDPSLPKRRSVVRH